MTETESPAPAGYVPGKHEAEALRFMNEWEPSTRHVSKHIVAQKVGADIFVAFEWRPRRQVWVPWDGVMANALRKVMVDAMLTQIGWANLTIMDEPIPFEAFDGVGPDEFDLHVIRTHHTMLCPTGVPGNVESWTQVEVDGHGRGKPLGRGGHPSRPDGGPYFGEPLLAARYRKLALPVETAPLGYAQAQRVPPALVRHDRVAREIVPKEGWGITGRPDLLARQIDRELAVNAAVEAEAERQRKAGEWLQSMEQIHFEVQQRMEKEWAAQAA